MPIKIKCPRCQKMLSVKESMAGKRGACPACKFMLTIPAFPSTSAAAIDGKRKDALSSEDAERLAADLLRDEPRQPVEQPRTVAFNCPMCDEALVLDVALAGKQTPCPECRRIIKVPLPQQPKKLDWRQADQRPLAARLETGPAPEGAWGTTVSRGVVSRESLEEAGALPDRRPPLSTRQRIGRGLVLAAVLTFLVGGTLFAIHWFGGRKQEKLVAKAVAAVTGKEAQLEGAPAGIVFLAVGIYDIQRNERDSVANDQGEGARRMFSQARSTLSVLDAANAERNLLLLELALAQLDLGDEGTAVEERRRLSWKETREDVLQTLRTIHAPQGKEQPEARSEAMRQVTRKLLQLDRAELAEELAQQIGDGPVSPAVVGLEMLRAGRRDAAVRLNALALSFYRKDAVSVKPPPVKGPGGKGKPPPPKAAPSLTMEAAALAIALGAQGLPTGKDVEFQDTMALGRTAALAVQAAGPEARQMARTLRTKPLRIQGMVTIAELAPSEGEARHAAEAAVEMLASEAGEKTVPAWVLCRLVQISLQRKLDNGTINQVKSRIHENEPLRGWSELLVFRARLAALNGKADTDLVNEVRHHLSSGLAWVELARHNQHYDDDTADAVEKWDTRLQPFGYIGVALGMQDAK